MENGISDEEMKSRLFAIDEKTYGANYKKHLLEQYRLCVEMADKNSARRTAANNFFLSANTLLLTATGILSGLGPEFVAFNLWWIILTSLAGILLCWTWSVTIRSYRDLSRAKFRVINAIERKLPAVAFCMEWECLNLKNRTARYLQLTIVERYVPMVFAFLFLSLVMAGIILAS
jgi:hypothetical protein